MNFLEASSIISCINRSCFFILSLKTFIKCGSRTASACEIKEPNSVNVNEHKSSEIAPPRPHCLVSRPQEMAKAEEDGHVCRRTRAMRYQMCQHHRVPVDNSTLGKDDTI